MGIGKINSYLQTSTFHSPKNFYFSGIIAKPIVQDFGLSSAVAIKSLGDTLIVSSTDIKTTNLDFSRFNNNSKIVYTHFSELRAYDTLGFTIPDSISKINPLYTYPQGTDWIIVLLDSL